MGLRSGGGIGDNMPKISFKYDNTRFIFKLILDLFFHIFLILILANIFFGVIVDAFNELRDENNEKNEDKKNKCFMCSRDRFDNTNGSDFEFHRKHEHDPFSYLYFILYLLKKNQMEFSRAENYAWEKLNLKKIDWFPGNIEEE